MKFSVFVGSLALFGVLLMIGLSEGGTVKYLPKLKGLQGTLVTTGGSTCKWMEKHYSNSLKRGLKVICNCKTATGNAAYQCEYYGDPHILGKAYVKKAPKFYQEVAQFAANKIRACDVGDYMFGPNNQYSMELQRATNTPLPQCTRRNRKLKQRLLELLLKSLE